MKRYAEANQLEEQGDYYAALRAWRELAEHHPDPNILCRLAGAAREVGDIDEAEAACRSERVLRRGLDIEKTRGGYTLLGIALMRLGKREEAQTSLLNAIKLDPKFEEAYYNLGVLLEHSDRKQAQSLFSKALELDPDYAVAHRELGIVLHRRRLPYAERHLRRAVDLQPDDARAHLYLGCVLHAKGEARSAIEEFKWAREAAPDWATPLVFLACVYEDQQEWSQAQSLL